MPIHDLLFTYDFPPLGGGISRWMEELARGYPPGSLLADPASRERPGRTARGRIPRVFPRETMLDGF